MNKKTLENNIESYHERFDKIIELFREGEEYVLNRESNKIKSLVKEYKENFKQNPDYLNTYVSFMEAFILKK